MRFLEADLGTSLGSDPGSKIQVQSPDPGPDPGPEPGPHDPSISDLNNILIFLVKRPYEPLYL